LALRKVKQIDTDYCIVGGHEGVGKVVSLGDGVPSSFFNSRVGVKWLYSTCLDCEICEVNYVHCPNQSNSGRDVPGTFQQYVVAHARFVTRIPESLGSEKAAPLLCAGITVFGAIKKTGLKPGQWLVIIGAGGGIGHLGIQVAKHLGYRVIAVDTEDEKRKLCIELGAELFLDFKTDDVEKGVKELTNGYGAHAVICLSGNVAAYTQALQLVRIMGTLVCVGLTLSQWTVSPFQLAIRGIKVVGSSVGTEEEMDELMQLVVEGYVVPKIEVFELEKLDEVIKRIAEGRLSGKAVLKLPA
jgi:propanol-preferring alcohol dehydrogenase